MQSKWASVAGAAALLLLVVSGWAQDREVADFTGSAGMSSNPLPMRVHQVYRSRQPSTGRPGLAALVPSRYPNVDHRTCHCRQVGDVGSQYQRRYAVVHGIQR